jgi:hypothetical protein
LPCGTKKLIIHKPPRLSINAVAVPRILNGFFIYIKINDPISLSKHIHLIANQGSEVLQHCVSTWPLHVEQMRKSCTLARRMGLLHYGVQSIICVQSHRTVSHWPKFSSPPPIKLACKLAAGATRECTSAGSGHATMIECTKICTKRRGTHGSCS